MTQAFHNDPSLKEKYVKRVRAHQKADEIIKGVYWQNGKGCAVGCTMELSERVYEQMEKTLGIPKWLNRLEDKIFEGLPAKQAKKFPLQFLQAIAPGADLSLVRHQFLYWLLVDPKYGVAQWADERTKPVVTQVANIHHRAASGDNPTRELWEAVARIAARASAGEVWNAARASWDVVWEAQEEERVAAQLAAGAVWVAEGSSAGAAEAARAAAKAAAESAEAAAWEAMTDARDRHYTAMAKKLLQLLKEAK